jgi:hypothetical protein
MKSLTYFLGIFAFATNVGDLITTLIALPLGATELNPLLAQVGFNLFFLTKIILPTIFIISCLAIAETKRKNLVLSARVALGVIGFAFLYCVVNNIIVISHII